MECYVPKGFIGPLDINLCFAQSFFEVSRGWRPKDSILLAFGIKEDHYFYFMVAQSVCIRLYYCIVHGISGVFVLSKVFSS